MIARSNPCFGLLITTLMSLSLVACDSASSKATLALGPADSTSFQLANQLLSAKQIKDHHITRLDGQFDFAFTGLEQGDIDIAMGFFGVPNRRIESLEAATGDLTLLSLSDALVNSLAQDYGYRRFTLSKDSYQFLEQDVTTLAASALLMANTHTVSDELAYQLAKVMYEHGQEIVHSQASFLTLDQALTGSEGLRIHPGAKRFYEDQGLSIKLSEATLTPSQNKREFILGSGTQGGTYYPLGGELVSLWNQFIPSVNFSSVATDASLENLISLGQDKIDLAMTVNVSALDAQAGRGHFAETAIDNAAFIGQLYPEVFHIISRTSNPFSSWKALPHRNKSSAANLAD